jgi:hypothetical protein
MAYSWRGALGGGITNVDTGMIFRSFGV